jgi:WYL domain
MVEERRPAVRHPPHPRRLQRQGVSWGMRRWAVGNGCRGCGGAGVIAPYRRARVSGRPGVACAALRREASVLGSVPGRRGFGLGTSDRPGTPTPTGGTPRYRWRDGAYQAHPSDGARVRKAAEELTSRVWTTTSSSRSRAARTLDIAMEERRVVAITDVARDGKATKRRVDPLQFAHTNRHWYLLAYCRTAQAGRWFRLDRIRHADLTRQQAADHDVEAVIGEAPPDARPVSVRPRPRR